LDLGVSSPQIDVADRGFSFQQDGPLDMRMDRRQGLTAADVVNTAEPEELAKIFAELGGERHARRLARLIVEERRVCRFETTRQLAGLIERVLPRMGHKLHPATRVFQALRILVNDELGTLRSGLHEVWQLLKPGGRLAVITFHSLDDRIVKEFGRRLERDYEWDGPVDVPELRRPRPPQLKWMVRKAILPGADELRENPRARSAQLRVMERL
jgi:16S rRNA (cytosine1402-N4)-methyltransferase